MNKQGSEQSSLWYPMASGLRAGNTEVQQYAGGKFRLRYQILRHAALLYGGREQ
jgi:hypothetical protein